VTNLTIRDYRAGDEDAVLRLLRLALGNGRGFDRTSAFWRWKHFENPFGPSLLLVAANGDVHGLRAFLRWRFRAGERAVRALRAVDTATHPAHRRRGVFSSLTRRAVDRARDEEAELIFNTPNAVSLRGYLQLGWTLVGRPTLLVRPLRPLRMVRALVQGPRPGGETDAAGAPAVRAATWLERVDIDRVLQADERWCNGRIRTSRSAAFLRWRYATAPSLAYFACWVGSDAAPDAAAVFRLARRRGMREVLLSELLLCRGPERFPALVRRVRAAVDADYMVAYAPRGSAHWWGLVRAAFVPLPGVGPYFTVRPLTPAGAALAPARLAQWYLSLGDLEIF
jgi:GNAT superfamily N-acetyltransferase